MNLASYHAVEAAQGMERAQGTVATFLEEFPHGGPCAWTKADQISEPSPVVAVHGPRARAHGPGWAGFSLQAHAMSPWAHAISLCGLRPGQI